MTQEAIQFETVDDLFASADQAYRDIDTQVETLLGDSANPQSAVGRISRQLQMQKDSPDDNFNTEIPLAAMRSDRDTPLDLMQRTTAMEINERVINELLERYDVDARDRTLEEDEIGSHKSRQITYVSPFGIALVENTAYGYKEDPNEAVPTRIHLEAWTLRNGEPHGGIFLSPPSSKQAA